MSKIGMEVFQGAKALDLDAPAAPPHVDVAATTEGGKKTAIALALTPVLVGFRSDTSPPKVGVPWEFIDWPFQLEKPARHRHQHRLYVESHEPQIAVAPDIDGDQVTADFALDEADRLAEFAETVVVVPKTKALLPTDVPDRFRVGIPNRPEAPQVYTTAEYRRARTLHILGGAVDAQRAWVEQKGAENVDSVDTNWLQAAAQGGRYWNGRRMIQDDTWNLGYYGYIILSYRIYAHTWGMAQLPGVAWDAPPDRLLKAAMPGVTEPPKEEVEEIVAELHPRDGSVRTDGRSVLVEIASMTDTNEAIRLVTDLWGGPHHVEATRGGTLIRLDPMEDDPDPDALIDAALDDPAVLD